MKINFYKNVKNKYANILIFQQEPTNPSQFTHVLTLIIIMMKSQNFLKFLNFLKNCWRFDKSTFDVK
jgi:hypothetical protein